MKYLKNTAAFTMCLLLAVSAISPAYTSFAEEDTETAASETEEASTVLDEILTSGDVQYQLDTEGNAYIKEIRSDEETYTIPTEIEGHKVVSINRGAFEFLYSKKLIIPASLDVDMSENPLAACIHLENIEFDGESSNYVVKDGVLYSKDMKRLMCYPAGIMNNSFTVPDGVEVIGTAAFYGAKLQEINLPSSLTTLERHCFADIAALKKIDLSNTKVDTIPPMAFVSSSSLSEVIFPENLYTIEFGAFMDCMGLDEITLPETLEYVGQAAFQGAGLSRVLIPETVNHIGYNAFGYKDEETPIEDFIIIGTPNTEAQYYCTDADSDYDYKNNFTFMTKESYERELEFEEMDVQTNGDYMYTVQDGEIMIVNCTSVSGRIEVPEAIDGTPVTSVYYGAFLSCGSEEIILPDSITKIGKNAFSRIVKSITLPGNCTEIEDEEPFINCMALESISVGNGDGSYAAKDGVLYNKEMTTLIAYPHAKPDTSFSLPATVTDIAASGCCYNEILEEADLAAAVNIGDYAFEGCTALKDVRFSKRLKNVGQNAFLGCKELGSVRLHKGVESIAQYAFGYDYDPELAENIEENSDYYASQGETVMMPYSVIEGFKMYVEKDSVAYRYATDCGIETVMDTTFIGDANVDNKFLYVLCGICGAAVLAVAGVITGKAIKKNKAKKPAAKKKEEKKTETADNTEEKKEEK